MSLSHLPSHFYSLKAIIESPLIFYRVSTLGSLCTYKFNIYLFKIVGSWKFHWQYYLKWIQDRVFKIESWWWFENSWIVLPLCHCNSSRLYSKHWYQGRKWVQVDVPLEVKGLFLSISSNWQASCHHLLLSQAGRPWPSVWKHLLNGFID